MTKDGEARFDVGHPAPDRGRVNEWLLAFALFGAAMAWSLQLAAGASLGGIVCGAGDGPDRISLADATSAHGLLTAINAGALVVALAAMWAAYTTLRHTGHLQDGSTADLLDAGEGRTRFLAIWAVFASLLFVLAVAFNTITVLWAGICQG